MTGCGKAQRLMASAAYEPPEGKESAFLTRHLASCETCRREQARLAAFLKSLPADRPELGLDLLPLVRQRLAAGDRAVKVPLALTRFAFAGAVVALVLFSGLYVHLARTGSRAIPPGGEQVAAVSPVAESMDRAEALAESRDYAEACRVLRQAVERYPEDVYAGEAHLRLASLLFDELRLYEDAYATYRIAIENYRDTYMNRPDRAAIFRRFDLLQESEKHRFASLRALDASREFEDYETVIARFSGTRVASLAARRMADIVAAESELSDPQLRVAALKSARERCTHPFAQAQLSLEIGITYEHELMDPGEARPFYQAAGDSANPELARLGNDALRQLGR